MPHPKVGKFINCVQCGKEVWKKKSTLKKEDYCSLQCVWDRQKDTKHPRYLGGFKRKDGYIIITRKRKRILLHRDMMEKHIGRELGTYETVHHINHNPKDNRLENLQLMTISEHMKHHMFVRSMIGQKHGGLNKQNS